jgi:hypothetical protein
MSDFGLNSSIEITQARYSTLANFPFLISVLVNPKEDVAHRLLEG